MSAQIEEVVASAEELAALADELHTATAQFRLEGGEQIEQRALPREWSQATPVMAGPQGNGQTR
jgi:hypothetical protein